MKNIQMKNIYFFSLLFFVFALQMSCTENDNPIEPVRNLQLFKILVGTNTLNLTDFSQNAQLPADKPIYIEFSSALDTASIREAISLKSNNLDIDFQIAHADQYKSVSLLPINHFPYNTEFVLQISDKLKGANKETFEGISVNFSTKADALIAEKIIFSTDTFLVGAKIQNIKLNPKIEIIFNKNINAETVNTANCKIVNAAGKTIASTVLVSENKITITPSETLIDLYKHYLYVLSSVAGLDGEIFQSININFYTEESSVLKFPEISDEALLDLVQQRTFDYFWSHAHPASGMARERNSSGDIVTTGGSGFGLMAIITGIERNFISRADGILRFTKIVDFLKDADRFHGVWPHWMNGNTGATIPFSTNDNGGDLVETAFMAQGLLTVRQYLNPQNADEATLIEKINNLLDTIEWTWYTKNGENVLYWHWSPTAEWAMNMQIRGYNEALIVYVMAATSKNHQISAEVYQQGWARSGGIINNKSFYNITLPVGYDYGGPMFFAHYSFLGLDPRNLKDQYADYWQQNVAHTLINRAYCMANPKKYPAYGENCWGLTASDEPNSYGVHEPTRDKGVITPTAALSSMPYAPDEVMKTIRFFYYKMGDRIWGDYGFTDAFDIEDGWYANSYLAIDQGPIVVMIENQRTGLLWDLFMSAPEVSTGLTHLGFTSY